jgi:hypothetical protein
MAPDFFPFGILKPVCAHNEPEEKNAKAISIRI